MSNESETDSLYRSSTKQLLIVAKTNRTERNTNTINDRD